MGRYMKQFLVTAITTLFFFNLSAEQNTVEVNYDFRYRYEYTDDESKSGYTKGETGLELGSVWSISQVIN